MGRSGLLEKWKIAVKRNKVPSDTTTNTSFASSCSVISDDCVPGETDLEVELFTHKYNTSRPTKSSIHSNARSHSWQTTRSKSLYTPSLTEQSQESTQPSSVSSSLNRNFKSPKSLEIVEMCRKLVKKNKKRPLICPPDNKCRGPSPKPSYSGPCAGWKFCETNIGSKKDLRKCSQNNIPCTPKNCDLSCIKTSRNSSATKLGLGPGPSRTASIRSIPLYNRCQIPLKNDASSFCSADSSRKPNVIKNSPLPVSRLSDVPCTENVPPCKEDLVPKCNLSVNLTCDSPTPLTIRIPSLGDLFPPCSTPLGHVPSNNTSCSGISQKPSLSSLTGKCQLPRVRNRDAYSETIRPCAIVPKPLVVYVKDLFGSNNPTLNATVLCGSLLFVLLIGLWVGFVFGNQSVDSRCERLRRRTRTCQPSNTSSRRRYN